MRVCMLILVLGTILSACGAPPPATTAPTNPPVSIAPTQPPARVETPPTSVPTQAPTSVPTQVPTSVPTQVPTSVPTQVPTVTPTREALYLRPQVTPTREQTAAPVKQPEPTSVPAKAAPEKAVAPARISIPSINLDQRVVSVGLDKNRFPIVPDHDIGWFSLSAAPGQQENIVFWGHVLRFRHTPNIPAPFARLKELKPGAQIILTDRNGKEHRYAVTEQVWAKPNEVAYILPVGNERVTMVSCIGDKVVDNGEIVDMSHRLITIAEPVS